MSVDQGKAFHLGKHERTDLSKAFDNTIARWNLFLYDGSLALLILMLSTTELSSWLRALIAGSFVDHLSILISGLDGDERRMIDKTMTRLRSLVESTQVSLFLVSPKTYTKRSEP